MFHLSDMKINCLCSTCEAAPQSKRIFTPTQFEQHGGCGTAKKWRISIRYVKAGRPDGEGWRADWQQVDRLVAVVLMWFGQHGSCGTAKEWRTSIN
jgi:hypothetical protein